MRRTRLAVLCFCLCSLAGVPAASAQASLSAAHLPAADPTPPGSDQRAAQLTAFVQRWSSYIQQQYHIEAGVWQTRLTPQFLQADAMNVATAMAHDSLDAALAALRGVRSSGEAAPEPLTSVRLDAVSLPRLGDTGKDVTYTPITPCRIIDTRLAGGPIASQTTNSYSVGPIGGSFVSQGGSNTDCGLGVTPPTAAVLNVTVVTPAAPGYVTVFPFGATQPLAASGNYRAGDIVNNSVVVGIPQPQGASDFSIYSSATSDVVVDIVGIFTTPAAAPLSCTDTSELVTVVHQTVGTMTAAACPAGYTSLALFCSLPSDEMRLLAKGADSCAVRNDSSATDYDVAVSRRCCRVPGR